MDEKIGPAETQTEHTNSDPEGQKNNVNRIPPPTLTLYQRVGGLKTVGLLSASLVVEIAAIGFIAYMEFGTLNNSTWRRIVTTNNANKAFTLTSTAFQTCVVIQGGLFMSMLAAIALERISVPLINSAKLSLMRASGTTSVLSVLLDYAWPMIRRPHKIKPHPIEEKKDRMFVVVLGLAVLVTTTLLQFTSTLLVSDLDQQFLPGKNNTAPLLFDYNLTNAQNPDAIGAYYKSNKGNRYGYGYSALPVFSYWAGTMPAAWPAFAEYSEPPHIARGVSDTGLNLRAFLPLPAENRTSIRNYTGHAVVFDSRVTCQKPKVSNMTFSITGVDSNSGGAYFGNLFGLVSATTGTPRMVVKPGYEVGASCIVTVPGRNASDLLKYNGTLNVKNLGKPSASWTACQLELTHDSIPPSIETSDDVAKRAGSGLLSEFRRPGIWNITGSAFLLLASMDQLVNPETDIGVDLGPDSPYAKITISPGSLGSGFPDNFGTEYAMTLCHASFDIAGRYVEAYSDKTRTEPRAKWNADAGAPNMTDVLYQLDVNYPTTGVNTTPPASREDRGLFNLRLQSDWTDPPDQTYVLGPQGLPYVEGGFPKNAGNGNLRPYLSEAMTIGGGLRYPVKPFPADQVRPPNCWSAIFYETFLDMYSTGYDDIHNIGVSTNEAWISTMFSKLSSRPAVFLQSVLTTLAGAAYYNRLDQYRHNTTAGLIAWEQMASPGGPFGTRRHFIGMGFLGVIIMLVVHLALGVVVILRFASSSHLTVIGDGWQAISHVAKSGVSQDIIGPCNSIGSEDLVITEKGKLDKIVQRLKSFFRLGEREKVARPGQIEDELIGPLQWDGSNGVTKFKKHD